ncbi:hypothetical protein Esi_0124_0029 [Ectocarpus siliculosus]|uniref:TLDc domain-containing protein n=1 Tax=Ectocarpus siliculosus TaxID=2880 RepID=D7FIX5_ECTSI|nr:hypothetical protein Esi_0124_0029 [Ectocarpus siliculosus]|eukprot:CBJ28923.1 hypothetical protein Esi_0124_0029 [Ectocarpus siliculosus]
MKAGRESAFGALVGGVWDKRVPRDADGRIVLDESPTCLKHIIHTLFNSSVTPSPWFKQRLLGGGTESASIVGGYSGGACWHPPSTYDGRRWSNSAFIFMLDSPEEDFEPVKWGVKSGSQGNALSCCRDSSSQSFRPCFGNHDMRVDFHPTTGCTLSTGRGTYDVDGESTFLALNGGLVLDVEVFEVRSVPEQVETPASSEIMSWDQHIPVDQSLAAEYTLEFGESIADLLMEELMALAYARVELDEAAARARTVARALCVIYGPHVARGEEDPVVELNVRGRSITTLYWTLHACTDSVFAAWLAERWSGGKGVDEDGRYKVNCDPSCFSKILDVMRMRKRAGWAEDDEIVKNAGGGDTIRVRVSEADRENFEDAVKMYFPNCTRFVMDLVRFTE